MFTEPFWFFENYSDYERGLSSLMISLAMLGMGASLSVRDFRGVFVVWKGFAVGMGTQILLIPVWAAVMLVMLAHVPQSLTGIAAADATGIAIGIALVAASPGGSASNLFTFLGKGNVALSVALTAITTFVCLVTTPIVVDLLVAAQIPGTVKVDPVRIVLDIALFLIVPLLAGMALRPVLGDRRELFTRTMVRASLLVLAAIIVGSLGAGRINLLRYGWAGPAAIILFCVVMQQIARIASRGAGLTFGDGLAVIIEVTIKNMLLALLLLTSMFPGEALRSLDAAQRPIVEAARDGCIYTVLFYGAVSLVAGTVSVVHARARSASAGAA